MIILDFEYSASTSYVTKDPDCCQWKNVSGNFLFSIKCLQNLNNNFLGDPVYAGIYKLVNRFDGQWENSLKNYPESCREDYCIYIKDGNPDNHYCFTPVDPSNSPSFSVCESRF